MCKFLMKDISRFVLPHAMCKPLCSILVCSANPEVSAAEHRAMRREEAAIKAEKEAMLLQAKAREDMELAQVTFYRKFAPHKRAFF